MWTSSFAAFVDTGIERITHLPIQILVIDADAYYPRGLKILS